MPLSKRTVVRSPTASTTPRQGVEGRDRPVELPAAVVGDDHARGTVVDGLPCVVGVEHALDEDRQPGRLAEALEVGPGARRVGEDPGEVFEAARRVLIADRRRPPARNTGSLK